MPQITSQEENDIQGHLRALALALADQIRGEERRRKQAEGIAAAKARGVRFGRKASPAPENFDEVPQAWQDGELTLTQAANACGLARGTFYSMAVRRKQTKDCSV